MEPASTERLGSGHVGIVVACCLTCGVPAAMILSTAGLFYPIIASDLGVSTAQISAWMSVSMLSSAVLSPIIGNLVARYNIRHFMLLGVILAGLAFFVFSAGTAPWMFWLAGGITGFSLVTCLALLPSVLINRWFCKHVGLIVGICTSFTGIGGVVFLALGQGIIDAYGWRAAYLAFAIIAVVVCVPAIVLFVREWPSDKGFTPYGAASLETSSIQRDNAEVPDDTADSRVLSPKSGRRRVAVALSTSHSVGPVKAPSVGKHRRGQFPSHVSRRRDVSPGYLGARERARALMKTPAFWLLVGSGFFMNLVCQVNGYFPLYVSWLDNQVVYGAMAGSYTTGAVLLGLSQVGNAAGKIGLGAAIDLSPAKALSLLAVSGGLGTACVWLAPTTPMMAFGGLLFGVFIAGGMVLLPMLVRTVFGSGDEYPLLLSRVSVAPTVGSAVGNILFPVLAESAAGFDAVFILTLGSVVMVLFTSIAALAARRKISIRN